MVNLISEIELKFKSSIAFVLVTIIDSIGSTPGKIGFKMLVDQNEKIKGTIGGGEVEFHAIQKSIELLNSNKISYIETISLNETSKDQLSKNSFPQNNGMIHINALCGGEIKLLYEIFNVPKSIIIFGAGHVGKAVGKFAKLMKFSVTVIDDRKTELDSLDNSYCDFKLKYDFDDLGNVKKDEVTISKNSFIVIVTKNHINDLKVLEFIYSNYSNLPYIGLIGSKRKINTIVRELKDKFPGYKFTNLYAPIGLNIGGESPEEIALSVVAEIQAVKNNKEVIHNKFEEVI